MDKLDQPKLTDFATLALERNDEAIRFSEAKAGIQITFVGLLLGLFVEKLSTFLTILSSNNNTLKLFVYASFTLIVLGTIVVIASTIFVVFPRLKISKIESFLYFGSVGNISENEFLQSFAEIDEMTMQKHLLSQVHATSVLAKQKFHFVRLQVIGAIFMLSGWLLGLSILVVS